MTISDQLRAAIEAHGLYATARDSGIAYAMLHRFFTGERDLRLQTADRLAEFFGLELQPKEPKTKRRAKG